MSSNVAFIELLKKMDEMNEKMDLILNETLSSSYLSKINIPDFCKNCSNHPSNGGSGMCHRILGQPKITC